MEKKVFHAPFVFKAADDEKGQVSSVFATLNVIDHDGDVTLPGAFGMQPGVLMEPWNHDWKLPVGKGVIQENGDEAIFTGQYFLNTQAGQEHYEVAKALGAAQEWSYTFRILEAEPGVYDGKQVRFLKSLDVIGVSQVDRGAGIGTRTVTVKGALDYDPTQAGALDCDPTQAGKSDEGAGGGEGQDESDTREPSGVSPAVVVAEIEILTLEV